MRALSVEELGFVAGGFTDRFQKQKDPDEFKNAIDFWNSASGLGGIATLSGQGETSRAPELVVVHAGDMARNQLEQMGFSDGEAVFLLGMSALIATYVADITATATYIRNNAQISALFRAAGVSIGVGALALQLILTPTPAH